MRVRLYNSLSLEILPRLAGRRGGSDSVIFFRPLSSFPGGGVAQTNPVFGIGLGRSPWRPSIKILALRTSKSPQYPTTWNTRAMAFAGTGSVVISVVSIVIDSDETPCWTELVAMAQEPEILSFPDNTTALNSEEKPREAMIFVAVDVVDVFVSVVSTPVVTEYLHSMGVSPCILLHSRSVWYITST